MQNLWNDDEQQAAIETYRNYGEDIALRVYTSRLIGANPALVLHGGGNTSVKATGQTLTGEETSLLYVKGSGWDLDTLEPAGLPGVRLDPLLKLRPLDRLSDEEMVNQHRINLLDASAPNPSVETLLHAFLPHKFIDHSHADAILVLANQPDVESLCAEIYGDSLALVPYIMPGFQLAKAAAEVYEKNPHVKGLLLVNHGLFTFGASAKESYDRHIEAVTLAEQFIASKAEKKLTPSPALSIQAEPSKIFQQVAPLLRGLYEDRSGASWTAHYREDARVREFAESQECGEWSQLGTATPDHVIRTKQKPLLLNPDNLEDETALRDGIAQALDCYIENYHSYFEANQKASGADKKELDPLPRIVLLAGVGLLTLGKTVKETRISADIYQHTVDIILNAFRIGSFAPLGPRDLFDMEYWSLEQAKLGKSKPLSLQGKTVAVTGAASGIGLASARLFGEHGANLFLMDIDEQGLQAAKAQIQKSAKGGVQICKVDVTSEQAVAQAFRQLVGTYGGLDILLSNAGNAVQGKIGAVTNEILRKSFELNFFAHQTLAAQAVNLFLQQKTGGVLLFNASKAAFNPGPGFGPYALPKAAVVALTKQYALDYGKDGIRANALNADRVRTGLFPDKVVVERAAKRGLSPDDYFKANLLGKEVTDQDVAQGFLALALAEKTTGSVLTIDGGNIAASPR
jgi:rhamnose utilization protein RhaD (predicted bifunctional aldolase and dehydrogenase)/NAD(P)-dependent dehydrogenase (short-subunit alcohol dehydrogenase family)